MGMVRIIGWVLAGLAALGAGFLGWIWFASEAHFRGFPAPAPFAHPINEDAATIARGEHIALTRGCRGCHGADLQGEINWGQVEAPNLVLYADTETPATLEAAIRHAIGRDGRALYSMPSFNFRHLSDADTAALIAYLRALEPPTTPRAGAFAPWHERTLQRWSVRYAIARGEDGAIPHWMSQLPPLTQQANPDARIARGEYLAMTSCNECHGFDLRGQAPWGGPPNPDLIVIGAYSEQDFTRLMREGVPSSGADLPMMGPVARGRFAHWSDAEVADLYAYLSDMSARAIAAED